MHDLIADQLGSASAPTAPVLVEMADLQSVASAFCRRAGEPTAEAFRLATLRDVLERSRALASALEEFARAGSVHHRGIHCTASMQAEMEQLAQRLSAWSEAIVAAGAARREWELGATGTPERSRGDLERRLASAFPGLATGSAPVQVSPT